MIFEAVKEEKKWFIASGKFEFAYQIIFGASGREFFSHTPPITFEVDDEKYSDLMLALKNNANEIQ